MIGSGNAWKLQKKGSFVPLFAERLLAVIPSSFSFAGVWCIYKRYSGIRAQKG